MLVQGLAKVIGANRLIGGLMSTIPLQFPHLLRVLPRRLQWSSGLVVCCTVPMGQGAAAQRRGQRISLALRVASALCLSLTEGVCAVYADAFGGVCPAPSVHTRNGRQQIVMPWLVLRSGCARRAAVQIGWSRIVQAYRLPDELVTPLYREVARRESRCPGALGSREGWQF